MNSIISPSLENKAAVVNGPKVGDILVSSYGYEACIAHFAKVIEVTKASVKIVRLRTIDTYGAGPMNWTSLPDFGSAYDSVETKRFSACGETYKVKDSSCATFYPWNGKPVECYNYH